MRNWLSRLLNKELPVFVPAPIPPRAREQRYQIWLESPIEGGYQAMRQRMGRDHESTRRARIHDPMRAPLDYGWTLTGDELVGLILVLGDLPVRKVSVVVPNSRREMQLLGARQVTF